MSTHTEAKGLTLLEEIVRARESLETANQRSVENIAELKTSLNDTFRETDDALRGFLTEFENIPKLELPETSN